MGKLDKWDDNAISVVKFAINQSEYLAIYQRGYRALFNDDKLIFASNKSVDWSNSLAQILGFNLLLLDKQSQPIIGDMKSFFLPFYINQDGSWQSGWDTFTGLQQFKAPITPILEYFSGIKPPSYYEISAKRTQLQSLTEELRKEHKFLEKSKARFQQSFSLSGPKLEESNFEIEIEQLTREVTELNKAQEKLKSTAVNEKELLNSIHLQINLANDALKVYESDNKYIRSESRENLLCPTCGAEHKESFMHFFEYAEDARILRELVSRLIEDATKVNEKYRNTQIELRTLESNYRRINTILSTRKGNLVFKDVVESMGAETAFRAFAEQEENLRNDIKGNLEELDSLQQQLKKLTNIKRAKIILSIFREAYGSALMSLNLPAIDVSKLKLTTRPDLSGSGGPRSLLAYYAALWATFSSEYGSYSIPMVIDAPNQQGQDHLNMPKVLKFIANDLPSNGQVIVGTEVKSEDPFDKLIEFTEPYKLLSENEFISVGLFVEPLANQMHAKIQSQALVITTERTA